MKLFDLTGKVAVITGSTQGIGRGIAEYMAEAGAKIVVSSRRQEGCDTTAAELNAEFGKGNVIAKGVTYDLAKLSDTERFAKETAAAFGQVDILVCNAAAFPFMGPSAETPPEQFDSILTINLHHNFRLCQALRPAIAAQGGGAIVLIGSAGGHAPSPDLMAYSIAKAGVAHLARCLADEFAPQKIRVNCIAPGFIRSHASSPVLADPAIEAHISAGIPLKRVGEPEDIAGAAIFLSSAAGSYVTGETIIVDGGTVRLNPPPGAGGWTTDMLKAADI